jgi:single-stranded-DNA-specific exonuclease
MTQRWQEPQPVHVPRVLHEAVGGHPLVAETLVRRGITTVAAAQAFLDPVVYTPTPPDEMPGMAAAGARIEAAIESGERICVWGDFDVDGQTATTVLVSAFRQLGGDVVYHIPVRATESHGIKVPWLAQELARGVQLVVTCDTGIDAHEAVAFARAEGVDIVITDHHELPDELPDALAIVNPHRLPEGHPLSTLPGVGVAYKVAEAVAARMGREGLVEQVLDLVALGIVADIAVQTGDTRYLLQLGLEALRRTQRLGLQELMKLAGVNPATLDEEDIGFAIGPRLNALGRLDDANPIVEFFTTDDLTRARILASELQALNARRQQLCDQVEAAAEARLEREPAHLDRSVLVLDDPQWPAGIIGIVANRLAERYQRPVVLLASPPGEAARGSARSVEGCHITEAIGSQRALLEGFGGHEMAAGLTIDPAQISDFARGLDRAVAAQLAEYAVEPQLAIHGWVTLDELSVALVSELARLGPFGPGNPPLVLAARDLETIATRQLGRSGRHLRVTVADRAETRRDVVWWQWRGAGLPEARFDLAFRLRVNVYQGKTSAQLVWHDAREAMGIEAPARIAVLRALTILDWRGTIDAEDRLASLREELEDVAVWVERPGGARVEGRHRLALGPAETLVIWSAPPSVEVLALVLRRVMPSTVVVVGDTVGPDEPRAFLEQLMGLVKHVLRTKDGRAEIAELAAAMGHREVTVRMGLVWMEARGRLHVVEGTGLSLHLVEGGERDPHKEQAAFADLRQILAETAAYRRYFLRADKTRVLAELVPAQS